MVVVRDRFDRLANHLDDKSRQSDSWTATGYILLPYIEDEQYNNKNILFVA